MKGLLTGLFGRKAESASVDAKQDCGTFQQSITLTASAEAQALQDKLADFIGEEVRKSPLIKESSQETVIHCLVDEKNMIKDGAPLNAEEKKALGLSPRTAYSQEFISVLSDEGLKHWKPNLILTELANKAAARHAKFVSMARMKSAGVDRYKVMNCGDQLDCEWCERMGGKELPIDQDFLRLLDTNCTCDPYCKCSINPIVSW